MQKIRIGVIGMGNMGTYHIQYLHNGEIEGAMLAAVSDPNEARLRWSKEHLGEQVHTFDNAEAMMASGSVDAVLIAVPHLEHANLAIKAFSYGLHVLCEKPAGVYTKNVRQMNEAAAASGKVFSMMFNERTNPLYQKLKELIGSGELGELKRSIWIVTNWYRSQSYYNSGSWRATWAGEGGGVLINQATHQLDLWQWIMGMMPTRMRAFCSFGKYRNIEVEDDVTAYLEFDNGATGLFVTTIGEAPGTNRLEVSGDRGKIVIEDGKLTFWRLTVSEAQFNQEYKGGFGSPECRKYEIPIKADGNEFGGHHAIVQNFADAVLKGTPLIVPGEEGINGLILSNAMLLSTWTDNWVHLPIDEDLYLDKLQERIQQSTFIKPAKTAVTVDMSSSKS
ncbi:Gfo/Idh/MocA family protein [Paenibacillus periandrae]|uniref:Gfo/Idh/MocA family protein n=1 Tax=Paenibacillus periandrae TaxID=1761741 RepID=UPI001F09B749|nr:Gfo/Idh/MocA family oxidoreductase [Paenibacillus periandrae]